MADRVQPISFAQRIAASAARPPEPLASRRSRPLAGADAVRRIQSVISSAASKQPLPPDGVLDLRAQSGRGASRTV